ncbi:LOW QUALITY PROTEIN: vomeronasal type-1 receptor 4-like [Panthera tigris]|uniref:LOW QUALITY PROTEIN: vomeronasal type-1 receptor 4-like n=1 Tax=Panthera tigris TaxID=9694 RepID=UPI001C6F91B2|nr:LOW QUALITY PROTEIN: vomeronasal type-1 receptor 4-like [Panthera tigris]
MEASQAKYEFGISGSEDDYCSPGTGRKANRDLAMRLIFLLQTIVGVLGNFSLLCHYLFLHLRECRAMSTDLILKHLIVANLLVIFFQRNPPNMVGLDVEHSLSDFECKLVFYVHKVGSNVAIGTICLLTVSQVIMISPVDSRWAGLKVKALKHLGTSNILCWVLNMMLNIMVLFFMTRKRSNTNITRKRDYGYCYCISSSYIVQSLYVASGLSHDGFCLGLTIWASGSMAFILHKRHKQQVQYILRNNLSTRSSPETRATQSILVLVSTSVSLWALSFLHICVVVFNNPSLWLRNTSTLIAACFPTVSPCMLMSYDPRVSTLCFPYKGTQIT